VVRVSAGDRREQLVEAAISRAVREGLAATTVRGIADEAGVSLSTVHYCFASKDDLLRAVARSIAGPLSAPVTTAITEVSQGGERGPGTVEEVLRAAFGAYWAAASSTPGRQLLSYELTTWSLRSPDGPSVARDLYDSFHATVEGFVDAVSRTCGVTWSVPVPLLARTVVATTTGVRLAWLVDQDDDAALAALDLLASQLAGQAR
jgi:AcrR family transcriptional regulator